MRPLDRPKHSPIGASSAERWFSCPGSVRLSRGIPSGSSVFAVEGTAAHLLAEKCLKGGFRPDNLVGQLIDVAIPEDNVTMSIPITEEMVDSVSVYVDAIYGDAGVDTQREVEVRFDLGKLHTGLYGTADCVQYSPSEGVTRVYDFKYGAGVGVSPECNKQMMYYALGAVMQNPVASAYHPVELVIVQPRRQDGQDPVLRWRTPIVSITKTFGAELVAAAKATEQIDAPLSPGSHCRWCPAAGTPCPALDEKQKDLAAMEFTPDRPYDPAKLAEGLSAAPHVEIMIKRMREFAQQEAERGRPPPGWKLVAKRGVRRWVDEHAAADILSHYGGGSDIYEPRKLMSPVQVEKIMEKEHRYILAPLIRKESSGVTLAPETDSRPGVVAATPEIEFAQHVQLTTGDTHD